MNKDLDEYTDEELEHELARRNGLRRSGLCSYCKQPLDTAEKRAANPCLRHEVYIGEFNSRMYVRRR